MGYGSVFQRRRDQRQFTVLRIIWGGVVIAWAATALAARLSCRERAPIALCRGRVAILQRRGIRYFEDGRGVESV